MKHLVRAVTLDVTFFFLKKLCKSRQREEQETESTRVGCGGEDTGDQRSRDEEERDTTEHELHRTGRGWESLLQGRSSMDETSVQDRHANVQETAFVMAHISSGHLERRRSGGRGEERAVRQHIAESTRRAHVQVNFMSSQPEHEKQHERGEGKPDHVERQVSTEASRQMQEDDDWNDKRRKNAWFKSVFSVFSVVFLVGFSCSLCSFPCFLFLLCFLVGLSVCSFCVLFVVGSTVSKLIVLCFPLVFLIVWTLDHTSSHRLPFNPQFSHCSPLCFVYFSVCVALLCPPFFPCVFLVYPC